MISSRIVRLDQSSLEICKLTAETKHMSDVAKRVISRYSVGQLQNPKVVDWLGFLFDLGM